MSKVINLVLVEQRPDEPLKALNASLLREPKNIDALKKRAKVKYDLDDYQGALEDFNAGYKLDPNDPFILKNRGATKRMLGDYKGAREDFSRADQLQPNNVFTLCGLGDTKRRLKDFQGALECLNKAHKIEPKNAFTLRSRGETKRLLGDYEGALKDLNRSDRLLPNNVYTLLNRGAVKRLLGDYQAALDDLNKADEIEPNNAFALQQRAIVRFYLGDLLTALEDIAKALKQFPTEQESLEWKNKILQTMTQGSTKANSRGSSPAMSRNSLATPQEGVIQVPFSELVVLKTLGEGGFGEVILADWRGIKVALKKLKSMVPVDDVSHEAKSLMLFRYKFIVTLMGITTDPETTNTILIMEYMKHGSLEDLLFVQDVKLTRLEVIRLALDIARGVNYLHSQSPTVLHRDLKSANVLLYRNKTRAKIADFGTAKFLHTNVQAETVIGNASIAMPPEMFDEEIYDEKVDVFAFGVILYEMLTNKRLPQLEENRRFKRICDNIQDTELRELVVECCASEPNRRPPMRHVIKQFRKMKDCSK